MNISLAKEVAQQIKDLISAGKKIEAIKLLREHTGLGLKEAKDYVELLEAQLCKDQPGKFPAVAERKGCLGVVVIAALGSALLAALFLVISFS